MAKGQKRSGREPKKPKAEVKKSAPSASTFIQPRDTPPKKVNPSTHTAPKAE